MVENHAIMYISSLGSCLAIGMASRRLGALGIPRNERLVDRLGNIGRYAANFRDLLLARRAQTLHRAKMAHKGTFSGGSHAWNVIEYRNCHGFITQLTMECDGKTVRFIAQLFN